MNADDLRIKLPVELVDESWCFDKHSLAAAATPTYSLMPDVLDWLDSEIGGRFQFYVVDGVPTLKKGYEPRAKCFVMFEDSADLILFKMRWI